ncbi:hypothetical protein PybrP1_007108, partial [[Pythium] brassicae (nom. inval.)]
MSTPPSLSVEASECGVCLEDLGTDLAALACGHVFHQPAAEQAAAAITKRLVEMRKSVVRLSATQRRMTSYSFRLHTENTRLREENARVASQLEASETKHDVVARELGIWKRISTSTHVQLRDAQRETNESSKRVAAATKDIASELQALSLCAACEEAMKPAKLQLHDLHHFAESKAEKQHQPRQARKMACCTAETSELRQQKKTNERVNAGLVPPSATAMDNIIKEGAVAVRSHFLWRERFVVVKKGQMVIFRRRDGSVKAKPLGKDCVLDCHTTSARDSWLGALFTARGRLEVDTESELVLSADDDSDDEVDTITLTGGPARSSSSSAKSDSRKQVDDAENDGESDTNEYSDALLAFQDVRSSMMQCHLAMSMAKEDLFVAPDASLQSKHHHIHATRSEEVARLKCLRSVLVFIESVAHGGRVVLLHLGVLASAGITVEDIVLALGEKQKENPRRGSLTSSTISLTKLYVATFVRDMLFHPVYSKRVEVQSEQVNVLIDRFFSHCRLRRFSHDDDQMAIMSVHPVGLDLAVTKALLLSGASGNGASAPGKPPPPSAATMSIAELLLKKKRHSFPNILTPLRAKAGLLDPARLEELLRKGTKAPAPSDVAATKGGAGQHTGLDRDSASENRKTDSNSSTSASSFGTLDSGLFRDDSTPEPLGSLLWRNSCQEIAEQISLFHHNQITRLSLWDFLHNPREAAKDLTESFNRLATYFVWSVLLEDTAKDRAEAIENIISIALAAASVSLNNFHLVMACVGCLGDTPLMVSRLPATWKKVRAKFKTHLRELRTLCDHAGGFDNLRKRQTIMSSKGSCIPFIGVVGVALERLRATTYFSGDRSALLDFEKLERQYSALHVLENAIQKPYRHLQAAEQLHAFLESLSLDFATPRLLQLRSQQILVSESAGSGAGSTRHTSFLQPATGESSDGSSAAVSAQLGSAPSFLTFRNICSALVAVPTASERVQICLEALFADDKQPLACQLRKFWLDFKS